MKNIFTTLLLLIIITISVNGQSPEFIKYNNGDTHFAVWYSGSEVNKTVVKRETYYTQNQGGELQKVENYKDGKLHGTIKSWNSLGKITEEIKYKDGTPLTKVVYTYYDNKKLKKQSNWKYVGDWYVDGLIKYYRKNGVIEKEEVWSLGYKGESNLYYESGQIKEEIGVNVHKEWNENGQIIYHKDNNLTEEWCEWYENGQRKTLRSNNGVHKTWYENGNLESDRQLGKKWYENGNLQYANDIGWIDKHGKGYDLSNLMSEITFDEEDCEEYKISLRKRNKFRMSSQLRKILHDLEENENYKGFIKGLDIGTSKWLDEFEVWWVKQRELCGVTE